MKPPFGPEQFQKAAELTSDGLAKFAIYHRLLVEWNAKINLVAESTLANAWQRHFMDSAQLWHLIPREAQTLADMGSGAGFPGMALALMGFPKVTLIERDIRKAAFLRTVSGETGAGVEILNIDAQAVEGQQFDVITSRAMADLADLFYMSNKMRKQSTVSLFLKGKNLDVEMAIAQKDWAMNVRRMPSATDGESFVLRITDIKKK